MKGGCFSHRLHRQPSCLPVAHDDPAGGHLVHFRVCSEAAVSLRVPGFTSKQFSLWEVLSTVPLGPNAPSYHLPSVVALIFLR